MHMKRVLLTGLSLILGITGFVGTAHAATKAPAKSYYRVITKTVKVGKVTIPANTRVFAYFDKKGNKQYANIELGTLRYRIRQQTSAKFLKVRVNHNFKTTKAVPMDRLSFMSKPKTDVSKKGTEYKNATIRFTTDGYVEYFKNDKANTKPISSTKVTNSKASGNSTYVYSKKNMLKLPDKKINSKGNYRYRLTVHFTDHQAKDVLTALQYSVESSKNFFYTPVGFA
ncbi:hypothetical protein ACFP1H_08905 [Secundilactobacillus hailunensis]|uniref:Surface layer protein A domain-containing protein n=1 Tax=Secundilactobacillus hailunensis TaxID=2559923 RepID=A0ABW1T9E0_9LACO|nr:hypothetical protein [Secundilactobacillus hailunensis]